MQTDFSSVKKKDDTSVREDQISNVQQTLKCFHFDA